MYGLIKTPSSYYVSRVFGIVRDTRQDNYMRIDSYIVLDELKDRLVLVQEGYSPESEEAEDRTKQIIVLGDRDPDWVEQENQDEKLFLYEWLPTYYWDRDQDASIIDRCKELDQSNHISLEGSLKNDLSILFSATNNLKLAKISLFEKIDSKVRLNLKGKWGCSVELMLIEDDFISIKINKREFVDDFALWAEATMVQKDDYLYLYDDDGLPYEDVEQEYTCIKAKDITFKIVPNG